MKAVLWTAYGSPDVLKLQNVAKPEPKDDEVLIRIRATTVPSGDCEMRRMSDAHWYTLAMRAYVGLRSPKRITILGMEFAGEVEVTGKAVTRFKAGDRVFGATGFVGTGTYAEYICLPENPDGGAIAIKPANVTDEEAAAVPVGGLEALHFLRQANIQPGQRVLINGAGGTIGTFAVQLAKHFGATVTAVDSADKLDTLRTIGADRVVDYGQEDFTRSGETYNVILDIASRSPCARSLKTLAPDGCYHIANPSLAQRIRGRWAALTSGKHVVFGQSHPNSADLEFLKALIEQGQLRSVIDRRFTLEHMVEAHRYVETGQKTGNVVISVDGGS
ncbi:MAG: NAD(P)-dependent alcohol dehydrogenase [Chloroflexi bacterium]|nr:NAD(P)-dependent alcohol dehydrogenase [Chloroflexota bacterium]